MSKRAPKDYAAMLRELRGYVRGFENRDGYRLSDANRYGFNANRKRAITRAHKELKSRLLDPHVVYRDRSKAKVEAVAKHAGMSAAERARYKVAIVQTPMPERTKVKVSTRAGKVRAVSLALKTPRARKGRKAKEVSLALESRDWNPERLLLDPEGEVRRITRGDGPRTKYVFKAGQYVQWRMGFPVGPVMLLDQVKAVAAEYGVKALKEWATGIWAFRGSEADFKKIMLTMRDVREDMRKVRRRAKRISKRARVRGRR